MGAGPSGGIHPPFDVEAYRERIQKMTDAELIEQGKWNREICRQHTLPWNVAWDMKLEECIAE